MAAANNNNNNPLDTPAATIADCHDHFMYCKRNKVLPPLDTIRTFRRLADRPHAALGDVYENITCPATGNNYTYFELPLGAQQNLDYFREFCNLVGNQQDIIILCTPQEDTARAIYLARIEDGQKIIFSSRSMVNAKLLNGWKPDELAEGLEVRAWHNAGTFSIDIGDIHDICWVARSSVLWRESLLAADTRVQSLGEENDELHARVHELRQDNAGLQRRVADLQRQLEAGGNNNANNNNASSGAGNRGNNNVGNTNNNNNNNSASPQQFVHGIWSGNGAPTFDDIANEERLALHPASNLKEIPRMLVDNVLIHGNFGPSHAKYQIMKNTIAAIRGDISNGEKAGIFNSSFNMNVWLLSNGEKIIKKIKTVLTTHYSANTNAAKYWKAVGEHLGSNKYESAQISNRVAYHNNNNNGSHGGGYRSGSPRPFSYGRGSNRSSARPGSPRRSIQCYNCQGYGHTAANCASGGGRFPRRDSGYSPGRRGSFSARASSAGRGAGNDTASNASTASR